MQSLRWFKDDIHKDTFKELLDKVNRHNDIEYNAALYVLAAINKDIDQYVLWEGIDFPKLIKDSKPWSASERAMVRLAANLFNAYRKADVRDIFWNLDRFNSLVAVEAIKIRFMGV